MLANNKVLRGRYRIIQPLGLNAATAVYEAFDSERETNVALKEILIDLEKVSNISLREKIKHDFANQAKILAKIKHESLPQVRGYFAEIDRHYLVMELIDGIDVNEIPANGDGLRAFSEMANWADQLLDTLDYLHTFTPAIIHRDINPANVKLTSRGKIKLLGFNIANGVDAAASVTVKNQAVAAVLNYLSLEEIIRIADQTSRKRLTDHHADRLKKILQQPIDAGSDIYALGATFYRLLTVQIPLDALERTLEIWAGKPDSLPTAHQANPAVPIEISDVLTKAMEIERENRFDSAAQMRQAWQAAAEKAQQRTAEESKKQEVTAAREAFLAEEKRLEQERQIVEQERRRIEAERKQQSELIERQLKEAEVQRIQAEQRAAEAEKRLSENQKSAQKVAVENARSADAPERGNSQSQTTAKSPVFKDSGILFAELPTEKKSSWIMPTVALAFLIIGGIVAGVLFMRSSNAAEANKVTIDSPVITADKTASDVPASPSPEALVEKASETTAMPPASASPEAVVTSISQTAPKTRTAAPPPPAKVAKPVAPPPVKAPVGQKRAVTVDDLIR